MRGHSALQGQMTPPVPGERSGATGSIARSGDQVIETDRSAGRVMVNSEEKLRAPVDNVGKSKKG